MSCVRDQTSPDVQPRSYGHLLRAAPATWADFPADALRPVQEWLRLMLVEEMQQNEAHAKEHYRSVMADHRLEWRTRVAENTDRSSAQSASTLTCRCMSDAYFLVYHIPASFISVQNIPKLSLQFKVIRKHFLPVLLDAQIKVFCVPDLTSLMLGGQGKIPAVHNFFRRLDPRVFKFLTRVEVVTLGSFKLKGDGEHGYVELDWFYETFPSCESVTSNVSVPRRQVDEL